MGEVIVMVWFVAVVSVFAAAHVLAAKKSRRRGKMTELRIKIARTIFSEGPVGWPRLLDRVSSMRPTFEDVREQLDELFRRNVIKQTPDGKFRINDSEEE